MSQEQDREFEQYLSGGSGLSDAYARLPEAGPPARLDHAILAEAHRAVSARPGRPAWRRWSVPLSVAATLIIAVLVGLEQSYLPREEARFEAPARAGADKATQDQVAAPAAAPPQAEAKPRQPAARGAARPPISTEGARAKQRLAEPEVAEPEAAPVLQDSVRMNAAPAAAAPPVAGEMPASRMQETAPAPATRAAPAMKAAPAPAARVEPQQAWLERIRRLKREGKGEEARKALAAFGQRYPDYPIPADLRDLR